MYLDLLLIVSARKGTIFISYIQEKYKKNYIKI
jgi:hypothetical protein